MKWVRDQGLTLAFTAIFLASLVGQAFAGHADFNNQAIAHNDDTMSFWRFVTSSAFWVDVTENWQSEYLQFTLFVFATIWLVQRGSTESKSASTPTRRRRSGPPPAAGGPASTRTRCCS